MSQEDVIRFLMEHKGWFTVREIADDLKVPYGRINDNCRRLRRSGMVLVQFTLPMRYHNKNA